MQSSSETAPERWPEDGLESIPDCPVCGLNARELLHSGLRDHVFGIAPGAWNLYRCRQCRCGWLDPRPDPRSIRLAYRRYFTHGEGESSPAKGRQSPRPSRWDAVLAAAGRRHAARTWGVDEKVAPGSIHPSELLLTPARRRALAFQARHLPRPEPGNVLLDVGCGNGGFLRRAARAGWTVVGCEPDEKARKACVRQGLDVPAASLDELSIPEGSVDYITLNHVLEHMHHPAAALRRCLELLKPGATLWLATPNLDSPLHRRLGRGWLGLDSPRHLVLFTRVGLRRLVAESGFVGIEWLHRGAQFAPKLAVSRACLAGERNFFSARAVPPGDRMFVARSELRALFSKAHSDELVLRVRKPGPGREDSSTQT